MSHTRAYAYASAVPAEALRDTLISVLEPFYYACDALEIEPPRVGRPLDDSHDLTECIEAIRAERDRATERLEDAEAAAEEAAEESRPAEVSKKYPEASVPPSHDELATLHARVAEAEASRDAAIERLGKVKGLVEAHADLVATARKFTSASIDAGVPLKHARAVSPSKRKSG